MIFPAGCHCKCLSKAYRKSYKKINKLIESLRTEEICNFIHDNRDDLEYLSMIDPEHLLQDDGFGQTLLHWGAIKGDLFVVQFIVHTTGEKLFMKKTSMDHYTALHLAIYENNEVTKILIEKSIEYGISSEFINAVSSEGFTALHKTAARGDLKSFELLYPYTDSDKIICTTTSRKTILHLATLNHEILTMLLSNDEIVKFLSIVDENGYTALHYVVENGSYETFKLLYTYITPNICVLQTKTFSDTVLHIAVKKTNYKIVEHLLEREDVAKELLLKVDKYGQTALHKACGKNSNLKILNLIIAKSKMLEYTKYKEFFLVQNCNGHTVLHFAAQYSNYEMFKLIFASDISELILVMDNCNQTVLHLAAGEGNLEICTDLCRVMKVGEINLQTKETAYTALHIAVQKGYIDIVKLLIASGADINLNDAHGRNVLYCAEHYLQAPIQEEMIDIITKI